MKKTPTYQINKSRQS